MARLTDTEERVYQRLLSKITLFLSYRPRTRKEVFERLGRYLKSEKSLTSEESATLAKRVVNYLDQNKLLNDKEFARLFIDSKSRGKNVLGRRAILRKLVEKGVSENDAKMYLDEFLSADSEFLAAQSILSRKFKTQVYSAFGHSDKSGARDLEIRKTKDSMVKYLVGRGFSCAVARQAIDYLLKRP